MSGSTAAQMTTSEQLLLRLLGSAGPLSERCRAAIASHDFTYDVLDGERREQVILRVLKTLEDELPVSGPERLAAWERGWSENLEAFVRSDQDPSALQPAYFGKPGQIMRVLGDYVLPRDASFETSFLEVMRIWLADRFLGDAEHIYEFGCGSGHNLVALGDLLPGCHLHGLDWAEASQSIVREVARAGNLDLDARRFDMFEPDVAYSLQPDSAVLTIHSLEQLGGRHRPFLDYLLAQRGRINVHVEPLYELYDQNELLDYLAARYSEKRGYLRGFLPTLQELERQGRIEILHLHRSLGSLFHDGWATVVWRAT